MVKLAAESFIQPEIDSTRLGSAEVVPWLVQRAFVEPQDKCWLRMQDEDLCKYVEELNKEGLLLGERTRQKGERD
jgi:hypothetical protein